MSAYCPRRPTYWLPSLDVLRRFAESNELVVLLEERIGGGAGLDSLAARRRDAQERRRRLPRLVGASAPDGNLETVDRQALELVPHLLQEISPRSFQFTRTDDASAPG